MKNKKQELEESSIKAAVLAGLMAITGLSATSAKAFKSPADFNRSLRDVKQELVQAYPGKKIPKQDLKLMVQACSEAEELSTEQSQEAMVDLLGSLGFQNSARTLNNMDLNG